MAVVLFLGGALVLSIVARVTDGGIVALTDVVASNGGGEPSPPAGSAADDRPPPSPTEQLACSTGEDRWQANACEFRRAINEIFVFECPGGGVPGEIWGDFAYTDDSAVCGAAVHAGVIVREQGGSVEIRMLPGQPGYIGTARNGITTMAWDRWGGTFTLVGFPPPVGNGCALDATALDAWVLAPCAYRGNDGLELDYSCPPGGTLRPVWGDGIYTDSSSVCSAAVHAGALSQARGGNVGIVIGPGRESYAGSSSNGVVSEPFRDWDGSFEVLTSPTGP
jgi:hypothetical protein